MSWRYRPLVPQERRQDLLRGAVMARDGFRSWQRVMQRGHSNVRVVRAAPDMAEAYRGQLLKYQMELRDMRHSRWRGRPK
jgi:hypothetical protein